MKPKFKSLCLLVLVTFIVAYACNKKDLQINNSDKYEPYKEWIHAYAGTYKNETIAIQTKSGVFITGNLNWKQLIQFTFEGKNYLYIPFNFQIAGKQCDQIPPDSVNKISTASFSLVLRQKGNNTYDIALNTKLYALQSSADSLINSSTIENYYTVDGNWINSWFYNSNIASPQKIYKKTDQNKNGVAISNLEAQPTCVDLPVTTYETECWSDGGDNNGTTCTSVPITTYYTFCNEGSGSGGPTGGGNYPPSSGGGSGGSPSPSPSPQQDPCAAAQPAATNATNTAKTSGYTGGLAAVKGAATANRGKEYTVSLNRNSNGTISASTVTPGGETSGSTPISASTVATLHNHPDNTPPSAGDVYTLISGNQKYSSFTTKYVTLSNGNVYAVVITNPLSAAHFATTYPSIQVGNNSPDFPSALADEFSLCSSDFVGSTNSLESADAAALALILDKYNAGVALLKQQSDGSFTKLGTTSSGSGINETFKQNNCPTPTDL